MNEQTEELRRDRGIERKRAFLRAGREIFFEQGYLATSVNDIVRRAGGSLATLYSQFQNKEGLFLAIVRDYLDEGTHTIAPPDNPNASFEAALRALAENCLDRLLSPDGLAFFRIIVAEGARFPIAARDLFREQPASFMLAIEQSILTSAKRAGRTITDPALAAQYFLALISTPWRLRALLNPDDKPTPAQRRTHIDIAVRTFIDGVS